MVAKEPPAPGALTFCRECGAELADHMAFCRDCGTAVSPSGEYGLDSPSSAEDRLSEPLLPAPASPPVGTPARTRRSRPWRGRRLSPHTLRVTSRVLLALGLVGIGVLLGWLAGSERSLVSAAADQTASGASADSAIRAATVVRMPDVRGLTAREAQQVLADQGVAADDVTVRDEPAAGDPDIVVAQEPVFGYEITGGVSLSVSTGAVVPNFRGRSAEKVLEALDALGAEVRSISRYIPGVAIGEVAEIEPAPGSPLPDSVNVTISEEPEYLDLAEAEAVGYSGCYSSIDEDLAIDTRFFPTGVVCDTSPEWSESAWVVQRAATRISGFVGAPSDAEEEYRTRVQVYADDTLVFDESVPYGRAVRLDGDVTGALRVRVRYRSERPDEYGTVALGNLRVLGDAAQLARLRVE